MNTKTAQNTGLWYGVFLSAFTVAVGVLLIVGATQIYFAEPDGTPYSYQLVCQKLNSIIAVLIVWAAAVAGGFVLSVIFPVSPKTAIVTDRAAVIKRLKSRLPNCDAPEFTAELAEFNRTQLAAAIVRLACALYGLVAAVVCVVYLADKSHFPAADVNGEVIAMLRATLPWIISAFVLFAAGAIFNSLTAGKAVVSLKKLTVLGKGYPAAQAKPERRSRVLGAVFSPKGVLIIRLVLVAAAAALIVAGILNGGMGDVLIKAIKICTECIGLG